MDLEKAENRAKINKIAEERKNKKPHWWQVLNEKWWRWIFVAAFIIFIALMVIVPYYIVKDTTHFGDNGTNTHVNWDKDGNKIKR